MENVEDVETVESAVPLSESIKRTSKIWKHHFTYIPVKDSEDGIPRGKCNYCGKVFTAKGKQDTSNLKRHLEVCPRRKNQDVFQMLISAQGRLASRVIDFEVVKEKLAMLAIFHEYSLSFVEHPRFRDLIEYLWPEARHVSRNTLKATIKKMNNREKNNLVSIMNQLPGRICLTSDMWTSGARHGYICLTAHFIDNNWTLHSVVLNMHHFPPPHSAIAMHDCLLDLIKGWGIEKQIFLVTLDNARTNDNMQDLLRDSLSIEHPLPGSGQFFHVRCGAHILNLIVQDGLKVIDEAVGKVRDACYWIEKNEARKMTFADCAKRKSIDYRKGLCRDNVTRWNSTYEILALNSIPLHLCQIIKEVQIILSQLSKCRSEKKLLAQAFRM